MQRVRIRIRLVGRLFIGNKQRPDHCSQQQEYNEAKDTKGNPQDDHSAAAPFVPLRYLIHARRIASAPLGIIMKLVEEVSDGTSVNRMIMALSGISESNGSYR